MSSPRVSLILMGPKAKKFADSATLFRLSVGHTNINWAVNKDLDDRGEFYDSDGNLIARFQVGLDETGKTVMKELYMS